MAYRHSMKGTEIPTSLVPMTETSTGLPIVFGTAPLHLAIETGNVNKPVLCYKYSEAVAAFGYSDDWDKYTLCEFMKSQFALFNMAPVVFVNVLDPKVHKEALAVNGDDNTGIKVATDKTVIIKEPVMLDTLKVSAEADETKAAQKNIDYTASYNDNDELVINIIDDGALKDATNIFVYGEKLAPEMVETDDIVGGVDVNTGNNEGLELINEIYPRFGLIPGNILAPGWSHNSSVAAVMKAKQTNISGCFNALSIVDIPTDEVRKYSDASQWKNTKNYVDKNLVVCWPMVGLDKEKYHISTQLAGVMCATDATNDDIPYNSPSNKSMQCDKCILKDGTERFLDLSTAEYLNGQGIVTALNFIGGWRAYGNRTSVYPSNTDVKDSFIPIRRMFNWINNTLITTYWSKIDDPTNKRLISTIVNSANIWFNGLVAKGYILGGRVEIREDENPTTDLMDGKIYFHVYVTPPSPAREIDWAQEYDPEYVKTLFAA